jgi:hypothetical protein
MNNASLWTPETVTGNALSVVVPSPNWPTLFRPKHFTIALDVSKHVWNAPAAAENMSFDTPVTNTGADRLFNVPSPNWPYKFSPQHTTSYEPRTAQPWWLPTASSAINGVDSLTTLQSVVALTDGETDVEALIMLTDTVGDALTHGNATVAGIFTASLVASAPIWPW